MGGQHLILGKVNSLWAGTSLLPPHPPARHLQSLEHVKDLTWEYLVDAQLTFVVTFLP